MELVFSYGHFQQMSWHAYSVVLDLIIYYDTACLGTLHYRYQDMWSICCLISMATISTGMCSRLSAKTNDNEGRNFQFRDQLPKRRHNKQQVEVEVQTIKVGLYFRHRQAPHTPPHDALVRV